MGLKKRLKHVLGDYVDSFDKDKSDKEGLKSNLRVVLTGLGAIGLEKAADIYANMGSVREWLYNNVYAGHDTLLQYASMHGQQELANHVFNIPPGGSTEFYAMVLGGFAAASAGAHYLKNRKARPEDKLTKADIIEEAKKKPVSSAFALAGGAGYGADVLNGIYHAVSGLVSGGKAAAKPMAKPVMYAATVLPLAAKDMFGEIYGSIRDGFGFGQGKEKSVPPAKTIKPKEPEVKKYAPQVKTETAQRPATIDAVPEKTCSVISSAPVYRDVREVQKQPASDKGYLWQNSSKLNNQLESMGFFR